MLDSAKQWIILAIVLLLALWYLSPDNFDKLKDTTIQTGGKLFDKAVGKGGYTIIPFVCNTTTLCNEVLPSCMGKCLCADTGDCVIMEVKA